MKTKSQKLKIQLMGAILSAFVSAFALTSATYAWYVANNKVTSETSSIMAEANGFMLQIVKLGDTLDHGSDTALVSAVEGHKISPASTEDAKIMVGSGKLECRYECGNLPASYMGY